jgi:ketosteroid isomerase-like protein
MAEGGNVELVRRFYDDVWVAEDLHAALRCASPEFELDWSISSAPYGGIYRGHAGLTEFYGLMREAWDQFSLDITEVIECAPDRLITVNEMRARGRTSGIEVSSAGAILWRFEDGRIVRGKFFQDRDEAIAAAAASRPG